MSDHISYNLSHAGFQVAKYVPFGPVKEVMPYLLRRADENTSVAGQTSRELSLIMRELDRRKSNWYLMLNFNRIFIRRGEEKIVEILHSNKRFF